MTDFSIYLFSKIKNTKMPTLPTLYITGKLDSIGLESREHNCLGVLWNRNDLRTMVLLWTSNLPI